MLVDQCGYSFKERASADTVSGEAAIKLEEQTLSLAPRSGDAIFLSLIDIINVVPADYRVSLDLSSGEKIEIYDLGYKFEDFVRTLFALRNEMVLKYLLMNETVKKSGVQAEAVYADPQGDEKLFEHCEPRLYETSLTLVPSVDDPIRIPYSDILRVDDKDYSLEITTESGENIRLSKMGSEFDSIRQGLADAMNELALKTQSTLKWAFPALDPAGTRNAARFLKEGRAARRADIESVAPELWSSLEKKIELAGIGKEYEHLKSLSQQDRVCIGIKRGLMGDLTGDHLWLLFPIYNSDPKRPGNALAMEVARLQSSEPDADLAGDNRDQVSQGGGNATYFFRISSRKDYANIVKDMTEMHQCADRLISRMNRLMLDINFRREPIYLSDERLKEPQYNRYLYAVRKIPSLKALRELFIGRVIHSSFEQWKSDVSELLKFNVTADHNDASWKKLAP
jgi:hypothetical protein